MTKVGLRIDVDTFRGTREGVPRLLETLNRQTFGQVFSLALGLTTWDAISGVW